MSAGVTATKLAELNSLFTAFTLWKENMSDFSLGAAKRAVNDAEKRGATMKGVTKAAGELMFSIANLANMGVIVLSMYGAYDKGDPRVFAVGAAFFGFFLWARERMLWSRAPRLQLLLVLLLVGLSFCLHFLYLPAGLCCFVVMIMTKNEVRRAVSTPWLLLCLSSTLSYSRKSPRIDARDCRCSCRPRLLQWPAGPRAKKRE